MKVTLCWDVASYILLDIYESFREIYRIHSQCIVFTLQLEVARLSETVILINQTT